MRMRMKPAASYLEDLDSREPTLLDGHVLTVLLLPLKRRALAHQALHVQLHARNISSRGLRTSHLTETVSSTSNLTWRFMQCSLQPVSGVHEQ
jgi:hypothetical protein